MLEILKELALELGLAIISGAVMIGTIYLSRYLTRLTKAADERLEIELVTNTLDRLGNIVVDVVMSIEQTTANELRELVKAGKANREELTRLGPLAVKRVKEQLGQSALDLLKDTVGDVTQLIQDQVEAMVYRLKEAEG